MDDVIADFDAIVFATRFCSTLAEGQSVEAALTTARVEMKANGPPDHDLPTMRSVDGDQADIQLITGEQNPESVHRLPTRQRSPTYDWLLAAQTGLTPATCPLHRA